MSASNLSPLELVVSHTSMGGWSESTRQKSQSSSGSDSESPHRGDLQHRQPWLPAAMKLQDTRDEYHYYLGDIYARNKTPGDLILSTQAEQEEVAGPYHEHIRKICRGWHHLRYLADFMTVSTVPLRFKELTSDQREERLHRVNINVVEYGDEISSRHLNCAESLDDYLANPGTETKGRLLVVQDLSTCMIEKLGAAFDIEPGFFRTHIGDYVWLNTRDPQAEIPDLEAISRRSNYFHVQFVQPRYFATQDSLEKAKAQTKNFNVLRRIDHDERFKSWSDVPGSDVGIVRSKVSLWIRPQKPEHKGWLGILLVDPTISHGFPLWAGYGNFLPPPSIGTPEEEISFPPYEGTAVQEFVYWTLNRIGSPFNAPSSNPDTLPMAFFIMICAQWIILCEYVNTRLGQIEYEIELGLSHLYPHDFDHTVKALLKWRRRMPIYHSFVERSVSRISARFDLDTATTAGTASWNEVLTNLRDILHRIEILHCRADKIMTVTMAVTAREESKKATQESHAITRVSYLAFIFVPLGFLSSFFSMSGDFPVKTYWVYAAIALPVSVCALIGLMFAGKIGKWLRSVRSAKRWRERGWGQEQWKKGV